jgi:hypothetical protein
VSSADKVMVAHDAALSAHDDGRGENQMVAEIDREDPDAGRPPELASMLLELVRQVVRPGNSRHTAQRFIGLVLHLCPDVLGLSQLAAAKGLGVTRASLSKTSIRLAEELNLGHARWRKGEKTRIKYRSAQIRAKLYGRHSSQTRWDLKNLPPPSQRKKGRTTQKKETCR